MDLYGAKPGISAQDKPDPALQAQGTDPVPSPGSESLRGHKEGHPGPSVPSEGPQGMSSPVVKPLLHPEHSTSRAIPSRTEQLVASL